MKEKDAQTLFGKTNTQIGYFELKIAKGDSLPYSNVKPHQVEALIKAERHGFYHKIIDPPVSYSTKTRFTAKKPFDCLKTPYGLQSYVVIFWYIPRKRKEFHYIKIHDWLEAQKTDTRKSLTYDKSLKIKI